MERLKTIIGRICATVSKMNTVAAILVISPFVLYAITLLLPTFDDWTYYTTPYFGDLLSPRLLPSRSWWRPFDAAFGWLLGRNCMLFPLLNHIFVYAGHLVCTFLVYKLSGKLGFGNTARSLGTLFFFLSPGMLGTVLSIDSLNQTYAQMWGLLALWAYFSHTRRGRMLWIACAYMATLSKENGIMFFVIPQVIAFGFGKTTRRTFVRHLLTGAAAAGLYLAIRFWLTPHDADVNSEYFDSTITDRLKYIAIFVSMTWIATDYVSLLHAPSRNLVVVAVTLLLSVPFVAMLFATWRRHIMSRRAAALALSMCLAALPHLLTLFSVMHTYASLAMAALLVACLADRANKQTTLRTLFMMYVAAAVFTDCHHWQKAYLSGLTGRRMGRQAIEKTGKPVDRVYSILLKNDERKYSSFCVLPTDAFGWGHAAYAATGYKWPATFADTTIHVTRRHLIDSIACRAVEEGYQRVWLVHGDTVDVIR